MHYMDHVNYEVLSKDNMVLSKEDIMHILEKTKDHIENKEGRKCSTE